MLALGVLIVDVQCISQTIHLEFCFFLSHSEKFKDKG